MIRIAFIGLFILCLGIAAGAIWLSRQMVNNYASSFHKYYFYSLVNFYAFAFYGIWAQLLMRELLGSEAGQHDIIQQAAALLPFFGIPFLLFSWIALCLAVHALVNAPAKPKILGGFVVLFGFLLPLGLFAVFFSGIFSGGMGLEAMQSFIFAGLSADLAFTSYVSALLFGKLKKQAIGVREHVKLFGLLLCLVFLLRVLVLSLAFINIWFLAGAILLFFLSGSIPLLYLYRKADLVFMPIFATDSSNEKKEKLFEHYGISPREQEIVNKICEGKTNRQIAEELFISLQTVKDHTHRIYSKIGINSRLKLVQLLNG
ncbi:MAG: LuxR C-terminal-related transcriptional regulator [Flavobacteriaceae bacterium]